MSNATHTPFPVHEHEIAPGIVFVGASEAIKTVKQDVSQYAVHKNQKRCVLITGETGTGKGLIARAIHAKSPRKDKPFKAFDCGTIPKDLEESHLFGHLKGSFTGAVSSRLGWFRAAHGGTLFLDEIGNLSKEHQPKLLRALEEDEVVPMGGEESHRVDTRIIIATNKDLKSAVAKGVFKHDLFYRFVGFHIHIPALRDRQEDIPLLIDYYRCKLAEEYGKEITITTDAINHLKDQKWPGNVRELEACLLNSVPNSESKEVEVGIEDVQNTLQRISVAEPLVEENPQGEGFVLTDEDRVRVLEDQVRVLEDQVRLLEDQVRQPIKKHDLYTLPKDEYARKRVEIFLKKCRITAKSLISEYKAKRGEEKPPDKTYEQLVATLILYGARKIKSAHQLRDSIISYNYTKGGLEHECWLHNDVLVLVNEIFFRPDPTETDHPLHETDHPLHKLYGKGSGTNKAITMGDFLKEFRQCYNNAYEGNLAPGTDKN